MKATGIVRNIDPLGRFVIPKELRKTFALDPGTPIELFVTDNGIFLQHYHRTCVFCGSNENLTRYHNRWICSICQNEIVKK
jgi:transcriptional pleiotropic regulator of transition state genes